MFEIRNYRTRDRNAVIALISELEKFYPDVKSWLPQKIDGIERGK